MKVVTLPEDREKAESIYGILHTSAFAGEPVKTARDMRTLVKLQDALEAYGVEEPTTRPDGEEDIRWVLAEDVTEIRLEDAHYDMLKNSMFGGGIPWTRSAARQVVEAADALDAAKTETPARKKKKED